MTSRLVVATSVSLDGVMQAPAGPSEDDSGGFRQGGWMAPHVDEGFDQVMGAVFEQADSMLLGRRSYEILASYWPNASEAEGAEQINGMRKYVATRTPMTAEWQNVKVLAGEAAQTIADLKKRTDEVILVQGSSDLLRTLQTAELVDEYHLLVFPVVLGQGKRLFADGTTPAGLELIRSTTTKSGVVYVAYEYAGEPSYGSAV
ncbi:dihydrofolate reductase family protein [Actinomadura alba]|uniref:Dihydrofolate reductase n=1 Tax=Actinomadura alba TaxID=406431 RepID=A0ABR7LQB9_9ACTN|nr:dihydrofolate reductase family protein [Actinomadura alba]MBC6466692.1 dihydrofolate reductase [Actinomadura alba]